MSFLGVGVKGIGYASDSHTGPCREDKERRSDALRKAPPAVQRRQALTADVPAGRAGRC